MVSRFEQLLRAMDIGNNTRKRALLLHYAGPAVNDIFDTIPATGGHDDFDTAKDKLSAYFRPQTNAIFQVYQFRQTKQEKGEAIDAYHTRQRQLSKKCKL